MAGSFSIFLAAFVRRLRKDQDLVPNSAQGLKSPANPLFYLSRLRVGDGSSDTSAAERLKGALPTLEAARLAASFLLSMFAFRN